MKCVLIEASEWRGSDSLYLKIAPVNTPVTQCVCVSFISVSLHKRKIRCTCACQCASTQAGVFTSSYMYCVCVGACTCKYSWMPELCASVLLNPALTGFLFTTAAHRRPSPSYVTVKHHPNTQYMPTHNCDIQVKGFFLTAAHSHIHGTYSSQYMGVHRLPCCFKLDIHSHTDRHVQTYTVHLSGHVQTYP